MFLTIRIHYESGQMEKDRKIMGVLNGKKNSQKK